MRPAAKTLWALAGLATVAGFMLLFIGPHMIDQPNRRSYYAPFRMPPPGTVPVSERPAVPTEAEAAKLANPLAATPENIERGRVYYRYYCIFCHGEKGDGNGEVGQSFIPAPADLRAAKLRAFSDGALLRSFLTGPGHAPVTDYTIPESHRWPLVLYLRALSAPAKQGE